MIDLKSAFPKAALRGRLFGFILRSAMAVLLPLLSSCGGASSPSEPSFNPFDYLEEGEEFSGGDTTVFENTERAFSLSARNLSADRQAEFLVGDSFFDQNWVIAPASTTTRDGLGPLFNARSCSGCHSQDGRGSPPLSPDEMPFQLLFRLSIPGSTAEGGPVPDPNYGLQLSVQAILGLVPEGSASVSGEEIPGQFDDGSEYSLLKPHYEFTELAFGPLDSNLLFSPRVAPQIPGLGLLEAISEADLLANADENDANGDGISGRPNYVWDAATGRRTLGRFGWKANQPSLHQQVAGAFRGDIGITSSLFPETNCTDAQPDCQAAPNGGEPEISDSILQSVVFYSHTLAVPARRDWADESVLTGKKLFNDARCTQCHVPKFQTGELPGFPELSNQTIRPYTDLLLHDMGPDLADGRPDFEADGNEWRTPPLWGIGMVPKVNGHSRYLHDGRARNLTEAVLWHGGEAQASREAFRQMSAEERNFLILFLESL